MMNIEEAFTFLATTGNRYDCPPEKRKQGDEATVIIMKAFHDHLASIAASLAVISNKP